MAQTFHLSCVLYYFLIISFPHSILSYSSSSNGSHIRGVDGEHQIPTDINVLQKHVSFFDRNHDGIIYPKETFEGFRAIGCGIPLSTFAAASINMALSQKTRPGKPPSLLFPIEVENIHLSIHGSDSDVYDTQGRFVPTKFEEIFSKHARSYPNALTSDELDEMLKANREPKDFKGWLASSTEWKMLYSLTKDKSGLLQKETIRAVYDGSLFEEMEKMHASKSEKTNA